MKLYDVFIILICLTACSDPTPLVYEIGTERETVEFSFEKDEARIVVSANCKWKIMDIPGWLTASPVYGSKGKTEVKLVCQPNPVEEIRKANLKIVSDEKETELVVVQKPKGVLRFYNDDTILYTFPVEIILPVKANIAYHWVLPEDYDWLDVRGVDGAIFLNIQGLEKLDSRSASVIVKADDYELGDTFRIWQMTKECHIRKILTEFYNSLNGPEWNRQKNWLSDKLVGEWEGIEFADDKLSIVLPMNNLKGRLPDDIYSLPDLAELRLSSNQIEGTISPDIRKWSRLKYLDLIDNRFSGHIPDELWTLPELQVLFLGKCSFEPAAIHFSGLRRIRLLHLEEMQLTKGLSPEMGLWTELERLTIAHCSVSDFLPGEIFTDRLRYLNLSYNKIKGNIPPEIKNAKNLEQLYLDNNELTGKMPEEMGGLLLLKELMLSSNYLTGKIPRSVLNLPNWHLFHLPLILPQKNGYLMLE